MSMKDGWRSAREEVGGQCVMITGMTLMQWWCADSLEYLQIVSYVPLMSLLFSHDEYMFDNTTSGNDFFIATWLADSQAITQANRFGPGIGPIFLDNVECRGSEESLDVCPHRGIGIHNCDHGEDAGVICFQQGITSLNHLKVFAFTSSH